MTQFYILGDMGSGTKSQKDVSHAIDKNIRENISGDKTFVCGLGDNIYDSGCDSVDDPQFEEKFEIPYSNISDKVKFYMCLGNHDYGYDDCGDHMAQVEYGRVSQKRGGKWYMPDKYYTFRRGDIEFFVLDTNFDEPNYTDNLNDQLNYFKNKIKKSKAKWKIVYGHHTWRSVGGHGAADDKLEGFLSSLLKHVNFDMYMCGHDHNKQVINLTMHNKDITLIVCGTGGKVYDDISDYGSLDENSDLIFSSNNLGYGYFVQRGKKMDLHFYNEKNEIEYIHTLTK